MPFLNSLINRYKEKCKYLFLCGRATDSSSVIWCWCSSEPTSAVGYSTLRSAINVLDIRRYQCVDVVFCHDEPIWFQDWWYSRAPGLQAGHLGHQYEPPGLARSEVSASRGSRMFLQGSRTSLHLSRMSPPSSLQGSRRVLQSSKATLSARMSLQDPRWTFRMNLQSSRIIFYRCNVNILSCKGSGRK